MPADAGAFQSWFASLSASPEGSYAHELYRDIHRDIQRGYSFESLGDECDTPLYAFAALEESDAIRLKQYKRTPRISWQFRVPGQPGASIIIKPAYRAITQQERDNPEDGWIWRDHPGSHCFASRHDILLREPNRVSFGQVDHTHHTVKVRGEQEQARKVRDFYYAFAADPAAIMALESRRCCLCGKPLFDPASQQRGIGPECLRKWAGMEVRS
jgi:hypothetical protein